LREITTLRFPKKFVMLTFDYYSGTFDLLHLRQYQSKMAVYAHNDLLCRAFLSSLKGSPITGFIHSQGIHFGTSMK